jgi:hypothetical protein
MDQDIQVQVTLELVLLALATPAAQMQDLTT